MVVVDCRVRKEERVEETRKGRGARLSYRKGCLPAKGSENLYLLADGFSKDVGLLEVGVAPLEAAFRAGLLDEDAAARKGPLSVTLAFCCCFFCLRTLSRAFNLLISCSRTDLERS